MQYFDNSSKQDNKYTIECNFYPIVIFGQRNTSRSDIVGGFVVRPHDTLVGFYGTSPYSASVTWNDTSVYFSSNGGYFSWLVVIGT